jgi:ActR/RegA family two-component response regulator
MPSRSRPLDPSRQAGVAEVMLRLATTNPEHLELAHVERQHILSVLDASQGNVSLASVVLAIHRRTLQRWMRSESRRRKKPRRGRVKRGKRF